MRVPHRSVPSQPITYLWERHREIARRLVAGERPIDIAKRIGMTPCRLSIIMASPIFKTYLSTLSSKRNESAIDISTEIREGATVGVQVLREILLNKDAGLALKAKVAQDFLDREGHGKVSKVEGTITHTLTASKIEELKRQRALRLSEINYVPPPKNEAIIDAEVVNS